MRKTTISITVLILAFLVYSEIIQKGREDNFRYFKDGKEIFGDQIDGKVKYMWDSVKVKGEYNYSKGKMDGLQKEYFEDGSLSAEWEMTDGKRTGKGKEFYRDGSVLFERDLNSSGDGLGTEYYKNGMKMRERLYKDGKQVHVSFYNHDIKGEKYKRSADELFYEAQEYGAMQMYGHAIEDYKIFLDKFPENEKCDEVKFLIAFNYHNNLNELDSAKWHYKDFIKKYPESPLAVSAKFELENIGKDIDNMEMFKK